MHPDYVGFRIWYGDGTVKSNLDGEWEQLPSQDVQFVTFYEERTYPIWIEDQWVTENYVEQFYSQDYYWLDANGRPGAGSAADTVDIEIMDGFLKTGAQMFDFWDLAAEAQMLRITP